MAKQTITKREYHALCGLMVLAKRHLDSMTEIIKAVAEITGEPIDAQGYAGHVSDEVWGGLDEPSAERLLDNLEITVES